MNRCQKRCRILPAESLRVSLVYLGFISRMGNPDFLTT